eukprot:6214466-Pleurochrysis_carterae.AAC.4
MSPAESGAMTRQREPTASSKPNVAPRCDSGAAPLRREAGEVRSSATAGAYKPSDAQSDASAA